MFEELTDRELTLLKGTLAQATVDIYNADWKDGKGDFLGVARDVIRLERELEGVAASREWRPMP